MVNVGKYTIPKDSMSSRNYNSSLPRCTSGDVTAVTLSSLPGHVSKEKRHADGKTEIVTGLKPVYKHISYISEYLEDHPS